MSVAECGIAWFAPDDKLAGRFEAAGLEHLQAALGAGKGVIPYSATAPRTPAAV